jgi:hypothetical protein
MTETDEVYRTRAASLHAMLSARPERHDQSTFGAVNPQNECGTTACVAGWSDLWRAGVVDIAPDGNMTWPPEALAQDVFGKRSLLFAERYQNREDTREGYLSTPANNGQEWLGLSDRTAKFLFYDTGNAEALEVLRRLGNGELARDGFDNPRVFDGILRDAGELDDDDIDDTEDDDDDD